MRKLYLLGACLAMACQAFAADPIISFSTQIYEEKGPENVFSIVLGTTSGDAEVQVDCGFGAKSYTISPTTTSDTGGVTGTLIECTVSEAGQVRVYGDAASIDYLNADGVEMTSLQMAQMPNLSVLTLEHNALRELDLTGYPALYSITVSDNPFTGPASLTIGADKPQLAILEMAQIEKMAPGFKLTDYPSLQVFDGYYNLGLTDIDPSGCPGLLRLTLDCAANVKTLDISHNPELLILNIAETGITSIDLTNNTKIQQLYCQHNSSSLNQDVKLSSLDVTMLPDLKYLYAGGNNFTDIDLSKNPLLFDLGLESNQLSSINIDDNPEVYYLNLKNNNLDFATLPMPRNTFSEYYYQQRPFPTKRSYKVGDTVDFSKRVTREGTTTTGVLYMLDHLTGESAPVDAAAYTYADGILTLNQALPDSVFMSFTNDAFPEYGLTSASFMVKSEAEFGQPSRMVQISTSLSNGDPFSLYVGMLGATDATPLQFLVDAGTGQQTFTATTEGLPLASNAQLTMGPGGKITVYAPEGEVLSAYGSQGLPMNSIDVTPAVNIKELQVSGAGLTDIDLKYSRDLRLLDLSNNAIAKLNMKGINGLYEKNALAYLNLSHNQLSELELVNQMCIEHYDISYNNFQTFNYRDFDNCKTANFSHNPFQRLLLGYFVSATSIDASGCNLTEVQVPESDYLTDLNLSDNDFTFADLPYLPNISGYVYAPQRTLPLPAMAPAINLSEQDRVIEGVSTGSTFVWTMADGSAIPAGKIDQQGPVVRFTDPDLGLVRCTITNPAFPALTMTTSDVQTADMPTNVVAHFTTTRDEQAELILASSLASDALFVDWRGDGTGLQMYQIGPKPTTFTATTYPGAEAKVYSYQAQDNTTVWTLSGATLDDFDGSGFSSMEYFTVDKASLTDITLPERSRLKGLGLNGNLFSKFDFTGLPNIEMLTMGDNLLTEIDLKDMPKLGTAAFPDNELTSVKLSNTGVWALYLEHNKLSDIDLSQCPTVEQLSLDDNLLRHIDLTPLTKLSALSLAGNYFDFTTLPRPKDSYILYNYLYQKPLQVSCVDGKVDLSSQDMVDGKQTQYYWFIGMPQRNEETGALEGEMLTEGVDYTVEGGITKFLTSTKGVMCVMANETFPSLELYTSLLDAVSGVDELNADDNAPVEYYNLQGLRLNGRPAPGTIYIERRGGKTVKRI